MKSCRGLSPEKSALSRPKGKQQRERWGASPSSWNLDLASGAGAGLDGSQVWPSGRGRRCLEGSPIDADNLLFPRGHLGGRLFRGVRREHVGSHMETIPAEQNRASGVAAQPGAAPLKAGSPGHRARRANSARRPADPRTERNPSHPSAFSSGASEGAVGKSMHFSVLTNVTSETRSDQYGGGRDRARIAEVHTRGGRGRSQRAPRRGHLRPFPTVSTQKKSGNN